MHGFNLFDKRGICGVEKVHNINMHTHIPNMSKQLSVSVQVSLAYYCQNFLHCVGNMTLE